MILSQFIVFSNNSSYFSLLTRINLEGMGLALSWLAVEGGIKGVIKGGIGIEGGNRTSGKLAIGGGRVKSNTGGGEGDEMSGGTDDDRCTSLSCDLVCRVDGHNTCFYSSIGVSFVNEHSRLHFKCRTVTTSFSKPYNKC